MMNKKRTNDIGRLKYLLFLPIALLLTVACSDKKAQVSVTVADKDGTREVVMDKEDADKMFDTSNIPENVAADAPEVYDMVEQRPMFPGGEAEMMKYLQDNIRYPEEAQQAKQEGRVICQFVVTSEGKIGDVKVMRGISPSLDKEAVRVIKAMPTWIPGKHDGQAVNVRYTLPIMFRLK